MKKGLRAMVGLAMAGVMTIAPVMTAMADTAVDGGTYQLTFPAVYDESATAHQIEYSSVPIHNVIGDENISTFMAQESEAGYEIRQVYVYMSRCDLIPAWMLYTPAEGRDVTPTAEYERIKDSDMAWPVVKIATFTIDFNGQTYPNCAMYFGGHEWWADASLQGTTLPGTRLYAALKVPKGCNDSEMRLDLSDTVGYSLSYYFSGNGGAAPATTPSASTWKQDAKGWWVEKPDGSYMVNEWYQSPSNGLWYYMGADGYMLTNTTTPDGYQVNADGVWVQ